MPAWHYPPYLLALPCWHYPPYLLALPPSASLPAGITPDGPAFTSPPTRTVRDFLFDEIFSHWQGSKYRNLLKWQNLFLASSVTPLRPRQQEVSVSIVWTNKRTYAFPRCQTERLKLPSDYLLSAMDIIPSLAHPGRPYWMLNNCLLYFFHCREPTTLWNIKWSPKDHTTH